MMNYEEIKALAKELKRPVPSLLALSSNNDPFYCGTPSQVDKAKWFAELWERFEYSSGVHLRRMHYQIVSQDPPVKMVNGLPYENTEACWDELGKASQAARYLDLVDPENFVDRRNAAPVDNIDYETEYASDLSVRGQYSFDPMVLAMSMKLPTFPPLPSYLFTVASPQRYHLELWCEKSTQDDILRPLAEKYRAALQYGLGELSVTLAVEALRRFEKSAKPVRIFYISDFDLSGWNMPRSMSAKLQYFNQKLDLDLDIKLFPVILSPEQVRAYNLPPTPVKETLQAKMPDTVKKFKERFQVSGFTELDALEALHPGVVQSILEDELDRYYDADLEDAVAAYEARQDAYLDEIVEQVHKEFATDMKQITEDYKVIQERFKKQIDEQIAKRKVIWLAILDKLEQEKPDVSDDDIPESAYAEERDGALFDSSRDYLEQNAVYQAHKGHGEEA